MKWSSNTRCRRDGMEEQKKMMGILKLRKIFLLPAVESKEEACSPISLDHNPYPKECPWVGSRRGRRIQHNYLDSTHFSYKCHPEHSQELVRGCQARSSSSNETSQDQSAHAPEVQRFSIWKTLLELNCCGCPEMAVPVASIIANLSSHHQWPKSFFQRAALGSAGEQRLGR